MTRRGGPVRPRSRPASAVARTRGQWSALVAQALACCDDWTGAGAGAGAGASAPSAEADMRRMALAHDLRGALTGLFVTECGWAAYQAANGFLELARAFARPETSARTRAALAPAVAAAARFLDAELTAAAHRAFDAAHANRPEVMG